jgi:hypothetical protein
MDKKLQRKFMTLVRVGISKKFLTSKRGAKREKLDARGDAKLAQVNAALDALDKRVGYRAITKVETLIAQLGKTPKAEWLPILRQINDDAKLGLVIPERVEDLPDDTNTPDDEGDDDDGAGEE